MMIVFHLLIQSLLPSLRHQVNSQTLVAVFQILIGLHPCIGSVTLTGAGKEDRLRLQAGVALSKHRT